MDTDAITGHVFTIKIRRRMNFARITKSKNTPPIDFTGGSFFTRARARAAQIEFSYTRDTTNRRICPSPGRGGEGGGAAFLNIRLARRRYVNKRLV